MRQIEYIQRIKELCMVLAKDKRELHDDNVRLHQQLSSLGKDVGEPRRWDDRNLMETLQSSVSLPTQNPMKRDPPFSPNGRLDYQNDFHGFPPFGMPAPHPGMGPHPGMPFPPHPGMGPLMGHQMRMPGGGPMPHLGGLPEFNPMAYPFFPQGPGAPTGPGGRPGEHNPNFPDQFRGQFPPREGQGELGDPQFQPPNFQQEHPLPDNDQHHPGEQVEDRRDDHGEQHDQNLQQNSDMNRADDNTQGEIPQGDQAS